MKRTLLFFCLIILLFGYFVIAKEIEPKIKLVYGRWGDKPGEFGFKWDEDIEGREGPNNFYVDEKGFIYILDNVNKRVQVFDNQGKFLRIDKEMYEQAAKKGDTRIQNFPDGSKIEVSTGLLLKEREEIFPNEKNYKVERKKETKDGKTIFSTIITLPSGKKVEFSSTNSDSMWGRLYGEDKLGNFYIFFSPIDGTFEYIKISSSTEVIGSIIISVPQSLHFRQRISQIFTNGNVYLMGSNQTGFWIDCYPTELFDKPEGRDFTYLYERKEPTTEEEEKEELKKLMLRLAKTTKGEMRDSAIMYLGRNKIKEAMLIFEDYLRQEPKDKDIVDAQRTCLYALREMGTEQSIELIAKYGLKSKDKETKIEAAEILINTPEEQQAIEAIKQMIKEPKIEKEIAEKLVYCGNWLKSNNKKEAIDIWIELLRVPKAHTLAREYLEETTGQDFGRLPEGMIISKKMLEEYIKKWETWWEKSKDTFQFPQQDKQ